MDFSSPGAFFASLDAFFTSPWGKPLQVLVIILGAILVRVILQFLIRRVVNRVVTGIKKKQNVDDTQALMASPLQAVRIVQRTRALGGVFSSVVTTAVVICSLVLIVSIVAPEATAAFSLITAALGAGLGFGAQNLVKDVLNGLFMVAEDQLGVGDVVDLGPATGVVEAVGIRITQIRDVNGTLWSVRNGEILRVGNLSQGWSRVIIDLSIPYDADVDQVQERMLHTAVAMRDESKWKRLILEKPEIWGIESISAEAIVIRLVVKTRSGSKDDVARELRGRLKRGLDDIGVKLPKLNSIVLAGYEGSASVRGARPPKTDKVPTQAPASKKPAASTTRVPISEVPAPPKDPGRAFGTEESSE
ncbi:MAG TPA: mechanosensitive ion channel domain-containing protein [Pseudolysinimonas sp.]|nr:mechanosensitive ion channel domain-containing protein [Pseudolysinimonas sp.]